MSHDLQSLQYLRDYLRSGDANAFTRGLSTKDILNQMLFTNDEHITLVTYFRDVKSPNGNGVVGVAVVLEVLTGKHNVVPLSHAY